MRKVFAVLIMSFPIFLLTYNSGVAGFIGQLVTKWIDDGRSMQLLEPYEFKDSKGVKWSVPKGAKIDGASVPRALWSVVGSPFAGQYRKASVIHNYYCDVKTRNWESVHEMFYDAMIASGVDKIKAKVMYYAVYHFGPRWGGAPTPQKYNEKKFKTVKKIIEKKNPTLKQIRKFDLFGQVDKYGFDYMTSHQGISGMLVKYGMTCVQYTSKNKCNRRNVCRWARGSCEPNYELGRKVSDYCRKKLPGKNTAILAHRDAGGGAVHSIRSGHLFNGGRVVFLLNSDIINSRMIYLQSL